MEKALGAEEIKLRFGHYNGVQFLDGGCKSYLKGPADAHVFTHGEEVVGYGTICSKS